MWSVFKSPMIHPHDRWTTTVSTWFTVNSAGSQGKEKSDSLDTCTPASDDYVRKPDGIMTGNIIYIVENNIQYKSK